MWQTHKNRLRSEACQKTSALSHNARDLTQECSWLKQLLHTRITHYFEQSEHATEWHIIEPAEFTSALSSYGHFIESNKLSTLERLLIILALTPVINPSLFDVLLSINEQTNRPFTEFGMVERDATLYASAATAAFILGGNDVMTQCQVLKTLHTSPLLKRVLSHYDDGHAPSLLSAPLALTAEYVQTLTTATAYTPESDSTFAASPVKSNMTWQDLVLPTSIQTQLDDIIQWVKHGETLITEWQIGKQLRPGYRALFYGPPGTGKTLTASVLGQAVDMAVYKIDLSMVTSKYIGETEKNLEKVFSLAEHRRWILFFDEADALFGKRQASNSANDQFANQNVAYLLQRIERFNGIVILASNFKDNIDNAFFRRFESIVHFESPKPAQRLSMWQNGFCEKTRLSPDINFQQLADQYPLSGADIVNIIRCVSLKLLSQGRSEVHPRDIHDAIARTQAHHTQPRW
ncbi:ATP-binding protein [Pseudoalteromonas sp. MMG013]|uniref:ATP-binding protein n=1 Tax=Pseudoalteromonas sp. MMG013 TaxID=2822687 RepID=UPI001B378A36|nr:ATP-binding protein [Pseudoalteromonas sp. MMG013]MBQ4863906.1 ATP-binding protein [Pseudoalteromonas sp. MMG013]